MSKDKDNKKEFREDKYAYQVKITNPELYKNGLTPYPVVQELETWLREEVAQVKGRSVRWLSESYFHRQEMRSNYIDNSYFFTPADGVITNVNEKIDANAPLVEVKGVNFTLNDLLQDEVKGDFLVITIFMTFYSQHLNYIPYSGVRTWYELPPIKTYNVPMLAMEKELLKGVVNPEFEGEYLKKNNREISDIYSSLIDTSYKIIRIGDYDVDTIVNFNQNNGDISKYQKQGTCFGKIQYGSSTVIAIPLRENHLKFKLRPEVAVGNVVKCRRTPLVQVCWNEIYQSGEVQHVEEEW